MTVEQAAKKYKVSPTTIYYHIGKSDIRAEQVKDEDVSKWHYEVDEDDVIRTFEPKQTKFNKLSIALDDELYQELGEASDQSGHSMAEIVRRALEVFLLD